jgi:ABC-type uncharacterized transport system permease subunit
MRPVRLFLLRLFSQDDGGPGRFLIPVLAVVLALAAGAIFMALSGHEPLEAFGGIFKGALGINRDWQPGDALSDFIRNPKRIGNTLTEAGRLILVGLAVALPFRVGLLNIGAAGQITAGGLFATVAGLAFAGSSLPALVQVLVVIAAAFVGGFLWGALAGALRAYRGLNEIITTIMLNFVAFWINAYLVKGPLKDPKSIGYDWSPPLPDSARIPELIEGSRISSGIIVALLAALVVYVVLWYTTIGFEWRATGFNPSAAHFAGMRVKLSLVLSMGLAGGIAGLAGALIIAGGDEGRLTLDFAQNYGFDGIPVAFIAQAHPLAVVITGLFFGTLRYGSDTAETLLGVPQSISEVILGLTMLFVVAGQSLVLVRWLRKKRLEATAHIGSPTLIDKPVPQGGDR